MGGKFYLSVLFLLFFFLLAESTSAQSIFNKKVKTSHVPERGMVIVVGGGVSAVKSDICGSPDCNDFGPNVSVGMLYKLSPYLGIGASLGHLKLGGQDKDAEMLSNAVSFSSDLTELTASVVLNLLDSYSGTGGYRSLRKRFVVPYLKAGGGLIYYSAVSYPGQGELDESQTKFDPERNYPAIAVVVPIGAGLRFRFNDEVSVAGEATYHLTSTDYLDNIGPRLGNAATKDHYVVLAVKVMYTPTLKNNIFSRKY